MGQTGAGVRLIGDTFYFPGVANSGFRCGCLIDTGVDASAYDGLGIRDVLITHGHADHFSSAADLRRAGARIVTAREEVALVENPEVNIRGMFSWAKPSDEMVTRLFRGEGCPVDGYLEGWHEAGIEWIPLPGHTLGHAGFLTDDEVLFTGDALYRKELWQRHPLPYAIDIGLVRSSLQLLDTLEFAWLVPGHGEAVSREQASAHIAHHLERIDAIDALVLDLLKEPHTTEETIATVSRSLGLVENPAQYWLAVTTVKGFLASLLQVKRLEFFVRHHAGYWRAI